MSKEDLDTVREISEEVWFSIQSQIQKWCQEYKEINQPYFHEDSLPGQATLRDSKNHEYLLIVSQMGSITLKSNQGRKYPIFYMSLQKYNDGSLVWESIDGETMEFHRLPEYLEQAILHYQKASEE